MPTGTEDTKRAAARRRRGDWIYRLGTDLMATFSFDVIKLPARLAALPDANTRLAVVIVTAVSDVARVALIGGCVFALLL